MGDDFSRKIAQLRERNVRHRLARLLDISVDDFLGAQEAGGFSTLRNEAFGQCDGCVAEYFDIYDSQAHAYFSQEEQGRIYAQVWERLVAHCGELFDAQEAVVVLPLVSWVKAGFASSVRLHEPVAVSMRAGDFLMRRAIFEEITDGITVVARDGGKIIDVYRMEYQWEVIFKR